MNESTVFTVPCSIAEIKSRKDHTFTLKMNVSRELSTDDGAALLSLIGHEGTMAFKEAAFTDAELLEIKDQKPDYGEKTPAQRLRAVLYVLWQQTDPQQSQDSESFYRSAMERIIEKEKSKLDPD